MKYGYESSLKNVSKWPDRVPFWISYKNHYSNLDEILTRINGANLGLLCGKKIRAAEIDALPNDQPAI